MRLKTIPEDFIVREATALRIRKQPGPYRVYLLEKIGWNTTDALMRIAREKRVPYARFAYGGKKDRHAHTYQYVTVQHPADLSLTAKGYSLKALGYSTEPMAPGLIVANHFEITVRELTPPEEARLLANLPRVREQGIPNYFDDQRFGGLDRERGFVAEQMLRGDWEAALCAALTAIHPEDSSAAKQRKRLLRERWGDWEACLDAAGSELERRAFTWLRERPGCYREILATAHRETVMLWVSAYQSFLWNEVLRRWLTRKGWAGPAVPGAAGPYVFLSETARPGDLMIPLPGRGMRFADPETGLILAEVLRERRLRPGSLEQEILPGIAFPASPRPAIVRPQGIWLDGPSPDERYPGHHKVTLRFSLPRGAYATMVIRGLLAQGPAPGDA